MNRYVHGVAVDDGTGKDDVRVSEAQFQPSRRCAASELGKSLSLTDSRMMAESRPEKAAVVQEGQRYTPCA